MSQRRALGLVALLAALAVYDACAGVLPDVSENADVAWVAVVLIPATFAALWVGLPLARSRWALPAALVLGISAWLLGVAGADSVGNAAKLGAYALAGFWFLDLFYELWWVVLVAAIVPWVDALSVWRGPTEYVVNEQPGLFDRISVAFRLPGEEGSANLGPPDVLFFALFLAAADRWELRVGWTWASMTGLLSLTLVLSVWLDVAGLPALPAICVGFLLPNADLLWRRWREAATHA